MKFVKNLFFISLLLTTYNMKIFAGGWPYPDLSADFSLSVALNNSDQLAIVDGCYTVPYSHKKDVYKINFINQFQQNDHSCFCSMSFWITTKDKQHRCGFVQFRRHHISYGTYEIKYSYLPESKHPQDPACNNSEIQFLFHDLSTGTKKSQYIDLGVELEQQTIIVPANSNAKFQIQISPDIPEQTDSDDKTDINDK